MAYDSLYGAYQKSHYPLEYYSIVLEKYKGDEKRTKRLTEELKYFNIEILPPKFRYSKSNYMPDKENNRIYKGVGSIKYLNEECSNGLYELRDNEYNNFIDLLFDIKDKVKYNTRQMEILIKLDYFSEFGKSEKLMKTYELFEEIYGKKTLKVDKWEQYFINKDNAAVMGNRVTDKQISGINVYNIMNNVFNNIPDEDISIKERCKAELDYLGYISYTDQSYNSLVCIVTEVKKTQYSIFVTLYQLNTGKSTTIKVDKRFYNNKPLEQYDTICIGEITEKERKTKDENGKWIGTGEYYNILMSYGKVILDDELGLDEY